MTSPDRRTVLAAALLLVLSSAARAPAQDTYYWNSPDGTDWTAANAWQFNSTAGPPATWVDGQVAVFDDGSGSVLVSTAITTAALEFSGPSSLTIAQAPSSSGSLTLQGPLTLSSSALVTINAPIAGANVFLVRNTPALTTPTLRLGGTNTFTTNLSIGAGGGFTTETTTLRIASAGAVPAGVLIGFEGRNSALVFDAGFPATFALPNDISLNYSAAGGSLPNLIKAGTTTTVSLDGIIAGDSHLDFSAEAAGVGSVFKLTRANTYTGNTSVGPGITLLVNNPLSGSGTGTGGVRSNGGTIGGTGRIGGFDPATLEGLRFGGTGRLAPGDPAVNDGIGRLSVDRTVGWIANGTYELHIGGLTDTDADRDQLLTTGVLRIDTANAKVTLDVSKAREFSFIPGQSYTYRIAHAFDGITMLGGAGGQFDPSRIDVISNFASPSDFVVGYEDGVGTSNFLTLTYIAPVPEPTTALLVGALALATGRLRARRTR